MVVQWCFRRWILIEKKILLIFFLKLKLKFVFKTEIVVCSALVMLNQLVKLKPRLVMSIERSD